MQEEEKIENEFSADVSKDQKTNEDNFAVTLTQEIIISQDAIQNNTKTKGVNSRNLLLLGLVSLFVDMSTEMVYPILPLFLVTLGTTPYLIGIIEGVSESISAFLRTFAGYVTDKRGMKKPFAVAGYSTSVFYKLGLLLSGTWVGVFVSKIVDKTGKGLRTAPRDALIAESGGKKLGRSFGLHKMLDALGAAVGVLLAFAILSFDFEYKFVITLSMIPAVIGVGILFFVKEQKKARVINNPAAVKTKVKLNKKLVVYLCVVLVFGLGKSSEAFLLLKANSAGFDAQNILLLYLISHIVASLLSIPLGRLSDKLGRKTIVVSSYIVYALVYFGFAFLTGRAAMIALFACFGIFTAMISGAEKAMLVDMSPPDLKGTALGVFGTMQGIGLLLSSTIAGLLWAYFGDGSPFILGGSLALAAAAVMLVLGIGTKRYTV